jgi:hypothetical protein
MAGVRGLSAWPRARGANAAETRRWLREDPTRGIATAARSLGGGAAQLGAPRHRANDYALVRASESARDRRWRIVYGRESRVGRGRRAFITVLQARKRVRTRQTVADQCRVAGVGNRTPDAPGGRNGRRPTATRPRGATRSGCARELRFVPDGWVRHGGVTWASGRDWMDGCRPTVCTGWAAVQQRPVCLAGAQIRSRRSRPQSFRGRRVPHAIGGAERRTASPLQPFPVNQHKGPPRDSSGFRMRAAESALGRLAFPTDGSVM